MYGLNWIDFVIVLLLVAAYRRAKRVNFWSQLFTIIGFFVGLFFVGWITSQLLSFIHDPTTFVIVNGNIVLIFSVFLAIVGNTLGYRVHLSFDWGKKMQKLEPIFSAVFSCLSMLLAVWLILSVIGRLPFEGLSNSANDAFIVQIMDSTLPPPPKIFKLFGKYVDTNHSPTVFLNNNASDLARIEYSPADFKAANLKVSDSIVRITSFGCGGIVSGSGFIVGPNLVATNAHVIAGVSRPIIKFGQQSYDGVPVFFDDDLDFAILRTKGLTASPLSLVNSDISPGTTAAILGYPSDNFESRPAVILQKIIARGRSIYGIEEVGRDIYALQTDISRGVSGGPMVLADGRVAGIIFAKSDEVENLGFALTSKSVLSAVEQANRAIKRVGTGVCSIQ